MIEGSGSGDPYVWLKTNGSGSGSRRPGSATLQRRSINIGLPQKFHIIHLTETTVMYLCRYDIGQRDSAQFIFLLDQRKKLIALFEWPAVIVIKYTHCMWHASFSDLFTNLRHMLFIEYNYCIQIIKTPFAVLFYASQRIRPEQIWINLSSWIA